MAGRSEGLRLRGGTWYADVTIKGQRIVRSALTQDRQEAERFRDELRAELWRVAVAGEKPRVTFERACEEYLDDREGRLRDLETTRDRLRWLCLHMGAKPISEIDETVIHRVLTKRRKEGVSRLMQMRGGERRVVRTADTVTDSTLDRYAAAISAVLNHACKAGWLDTAPKIAKLSKRNAGAPKFLTAEQVDALLSKLPEHSRAMTVFALSTGLRRSNVTGLTWDRVDMARRKAWIPGMQTKGRRDIAVPLSDEAVAVLKGQLGKHKSVVFPYRGERVVRVTGVSWRKALAAAGLPAGTRFHDLRHTWASWHAMNGTPLAVLQQLGGWQTASMVQVYAALSQEVVTDYAGNAKPVSFVSGQQHEKSG